MAYYRILPSLFVAATLISAAGVARADDGYALDYAVGGEVGYAGAGYEAAGAVSGPPVLAPPTLDYNHYYPTPMAGGYPARLYLCPRPVPLHVGYTYITYQPFAPHEFLHWHRRAYIAYHPHGVTLTEVEWK